MTSLTESESSEKEVTLYNYVDNMIVSENQHSKIDTICKI